MTKVAIAYHSGFGHTQRQAEAVRAGAASVAGVEATLYAVDALDEAQWTALDAADAIVFGSPTYMGNASAKFKEFMETSSKRWFTQAWKDKLAAGFTTSASQSGDKLNTLLQLMVFANQYAGALSRLKGEQPLVKYAREAGFEPELVFTRSKAHFRHVLRERVIGKESMIAVAGVLKPAPGEADG